EARLFFHFRTEDQAGKITEDQSCRCAHRSGAEASLEQSEKTGLIHRLLDTVKQEMAESDQRHGSPRSRIFKQWLIQAQKTEDRSGTYQQHHDPSRHQLRSVQQDLRQGTDQSSNPESIDIFHHFFSSSSCSITTAWAIPGTLCPS